MRSGDDPPSGDDSTRGGARRWADFGVLAALWAMVFASSSQVMIMAPILPRIHDELGVSPALSGSLISGYAVTLSVFALVTGPISDRVGRRAVLLWGSGAMAVALLLHPFAVDFATLLGVRILAGIAGGVLTGSAVSFVGDHFPYHRRGWANGWVMSGFALGQVVGVPLGTILAARHGFAAAFLLFAAVMATAFVLVLLVVPQPRVERADRPLTLASGLAEYAALLSMRPARGAALVYASMFFAVSNFVVYLPSWAEAELDLDASGVATMFAVGGVASVLFGPTAGKLSDRIGRRPLILVSCLAGALHFATTTVFARGAASAAIMFFLAMVILALRLSPLQALLTALVPDARRGAFMSLVVAVGQIGGGLGAGVAGLLYTELGYGACTIAAAAAMLVTAWLVWHELPEPARDGA
ncbi:MAG: MFS transporter [Myxococcales bacterium]|nr:MFS transporter [Myxococcales bacterium]